MKVCICIFLWWLICAMSYFLSVSRQAQTQQYDSVRDSRIIVFSPCAPRSVSEQISHPYFSDVFFHFFLFFFFFFVFFQLFFCRFRSIFIINQFRLTVFTLVHIHFFKDRQGQYIEKSKKNSIVSAADSNTIDIENENHFIQ
jgi:hypothetical protein